MSDAPELTGGLRGGSRRRSFFRPGTRGMGVLFTSGILATMLWADLYDTTSTEDRLIIGAVMGTLGFVAFQGGVWPVVLLRPDHVTVRNPLATYEVSGHPGVLHRARGTTPSITAPGSRDIYLFTFSSALIDDLTGNRAERRFAHAFDESVRVSESARRDVTVSYRSLLVQFAALHVSLAVASLLAGAVA